MVHFPDGAPSGEKTAANGAAPHFGIERNFLGLHSFLLIFKLACFYWPGEVINTDNTARGENAET